MESIIWVKYTQEGFHFWEDAPDDVAYLKNEHRHLFNFKVSFKVTHDERDLEFHQVMRKCKKISEELLRVARINGGSCETIAREFYNYLYKLNKLPVVSVEVSEDGECGALICA